MNDGTSDLSDEAQCNPTSTGILLQQMSSIEDLFEVFSAAIDQPDRALWWNVDYVTLQAKIDLISVEPNLPDYFKSRLKFMSKYLEESQWDAFKIQEQSRIQAAQIIAMTQRSEEDEANFKAMKARIIERKVA